MKLDINQIIKCFKEYTTFATGKRPPSKKEFLMNIEEKENNPDFIGDMEAILRPEIKYNQEAAFGIPELFMVIAVGIMGKEGFNYLKRYLSLILRRYGLPDEVSPIRHSVGLVMFAIPLLGSVSAPYFSHKLVFFENREITIMITLHTMLFLSLFVLGGDFWDKLRGLFIRRAKINFGST